MFTPVSRLGEELEQLVIQSSGDQALAREVARFVSDVAEQVDLAFSDVHDVLREVAFLSPSELSPDRITHVQEKLAGTHSREKFKKVLGICDRLSVLANQYRQQIEPRLTQVGAAPQSSELFWLLEKHEGAFIYTIKNAVNEINAILDGYQPGQNINDARARARQSLAELENGLQAVMHARNRVVAALPDGAALLLDPKRIADDVLRRSPWFSGSFYLATALLLLTGLTIVAGTVSALAFPLVVAGTFAGLTVVGAFQLKNDNRLSEQSFLQLIDLAMRRVLLPLSKRS
jgi:hypothetical protein